MQSSSEFAHRQIGDVLGSAPELAASGFHDPYRFHCLCRRARCRRRPSRAGCDRAGRAGARIRLSARICHVPRSYSRRPDLSDGRCTRPRLPGADLRPGVPRGQMAGRRLSRLPGVEVLVDRDHAGVHRGKEGQHGCSSQCARRVGAHIGQPEDDDLLCRDHPDGHRPAHHHAGGLWRACAGHRAGADGRARALSAAGGQGAWPAQVAARAEISEPRRCHLHGRRCGGDRRAA